MALFAAGVAFAAGGDLDSTFGVGGILEPAFAPGAQPTPASGVSQLEVAPDGKLLLGVGWQPVHGYSGGGVLRLTSGGLPDPHFSSTNAIPRMVARPGLAVTGYDQVSALDRQRDGRILVAFPNAQITYSHTSTLRLGRLLSDGRLDRSFGAHGVLDTGLVWDTLEPGGLRALQNGMFLVAGTRPDPVTGGFHASLARFRSNGTIDRSFGSGGVAEVPSNAMLGDQGWQVGVRPDGDYELLGADGGGNPETGMTLVARISRTGAVVEAPRFRFADRCCNQRAMLVLRDGRTLLAGAIQTSPPTQTPTTIAASVEALTPRLTLDTSFDPRGGTPGMTTLPIPGNYPGGADAIALQRNGDYLVSGEYDASNSGFENTDIFVARLTPGGAPDPSFNPSSSAPAMTVTDPAGGTRAALAGGVVTEPDGSIAIAGEVTNPGANGQTTSVFLAKFLGDKHPGRCAARRRCSWR